MDLYAQTVLAKTFLILKFKCVQCRKQTSVTAGTIFDKTITPLKNWFAAVPPCQNSCHPLNLIFSERGVVTEQ
jgi:hypothetical protein